jgi:drug/metabolite transporter (DMT)-like permease
MMEQEFAAKKARVFVLVGVGIAAFVGAYQFSSSDVTSSIASVIFMVAGLIFFVIAGRMAKKMQKETAAK